MPRAKPPVKLVEVDEPDSPIEQSKQQQLALADMSHPLHAFYVLENLMGVGVSALELAAEGEAANLEDVKRRALTIAGLAQKVALWCDRLHWVRTHPDNPANGRTPYG